MRSYAVKRVLPRGVPQEVLVSFPTLVGLYHYCLQNRQFSIRPAEERSSCCGCFRDDPELHACAERVCGQQTPAVLEAELVLVAVVLVNIAPIANNVADEVSERVVPGCPECFQNTRSRDDRAGREPNPPHFAFLNCPLLTA